MKKCPHCVHKRKYCVGDVWINLGGYYVVVYWDREEGALKLLYTHTGEYGTSVNHIDETGEIGWKLIFRNGREV